MLVAILVETLVFPYVYEDVDFSIDGKVKLGFSLWLRWMDSTFVLVLVARARNRVNGSMFGVENWIMTQYSKPFDLSPLYESRQQ